MNSNLKVLLSTVGAAVIAVGLVASASAQAKRPSTNQYQYQSTSPATSAYGSEESRDPHNDR